jgi:hypothetical protein
MMGYFEFLENWAELRNKGSMEKEALADYDYRKQAEIEEVIHLVMPSKHLKENISVWIPFTYRPFTENFWTWNFTAPVICSGKMESSLNVFVLLWITVNLARGESVNFNPILADVAPEERDDLVFKVKEEASTINLEHLDLDLLERFREQLKQDRSSFIMGTGFQLKTSSRDKTWKSPTRILTRASKRPKRSLQRLPAVPLTKFPRMRFEILKGCSRIWRRFTRVSSGLRRIWIRASRSPRDKRDGLKAPGK